MANLLRSIIAGPRARHSDSNLDLCYVTPFLIATSGPSGTYPQRAYRNPLDQLVKFLDKQHGENWCIWEFRAEGTGYPDSEVYGRVRHYPFPDHHPPPFAIVPLVMGSMKQWLGDGSHASVETQDAEGRDGKVVIVHCKAGKGRSGTMATSYLISECGWTMEKALARFTERRMRPGFGQGVSIPSQLRWVGYTDRWAKGGKTYLERQIQILEVHVWGLRDGVKVAVEGLEEEGKVIKTLHIFGKRERMVVEGNTPGGAGFKDMLSDMAGYGSGNTPDSGLNESNLSSVMGHAGGLTPESVSNAASEHNSKSGKAEDLKGWISHQSRTRTMSSMQSNPQDEVGNEVGGSAVVFRPRALLITPTSDINIDFERRNKAGIGLTMVTSVAHVWFNAFFEGNGAEQNGRPDEEGVFEIEWDKMDGIKGSLRKGTRALDRLAVVWKAYTPPGGLSAEHEIHEAGPDTPIQQMRAADWKGADAPSTGLAKDLGIREESPASANVSKANSVKSVEPENVVEKNSDSEPLEEGVKSHGPGGEEQISADASRSS